MRHTKTHRKLAEVLAPYGLTYADQGRHYSIVNRQGNYVTSVAASPSDPHFARQTIRYLVRAGLVPDDLRKVKF
jgi:hypothetical protein